MSKFKELLLATALVTTTPLSGAQAPQQVSIQSGKVSHILQFTRQDESKFIELLGSDYIVSLTLGKEENPLFEFFHKNWHTLSQDFHLDFSRILIESLVKRGLTDSSFLKDKVNHIGAVFDGGKRIFYIEFERKGENGNPIPLLVEYNYNGDIIPDKEMLKVFDMVGFTFLKNENIIDFGEIDMSVQYLGDGAFPSEIQEAYSSRSLLNYIKLDGVKGFNVLHNGKDGDVVVTITYENSRRNTQLHGIKDGTGKSL